MTDIRVDDVRPVGRDRAQVVRARREAASCRGSRRTAPSCPRRSSVHVPAPAGLRSNVTCVVSADVVVVSATVPRIAAPGSSSVTVGGWLSTTIVREDETVGPLPATSFASTVTDTGPSGVEVESQFTEAGVPLAVPTTVPFTLKTIWPTPDVASDAEPLERDDPARVRAGRGSRHRGRARSGVVDHLRTGQVDRRHVRRNRRVRDHLAEVVLAVGDRGRVERDRPRRGGGRADRRPRAGAVRRALERDGGDARAGIGRRRVGERDGAGEDGSRIDRCSARRLRVDRDGSRAAPPRCCRRCRRSSSRSCASRRSSGRSARGRARSCRVCQPPPSTR